MKNLKFYKNVAYNEKSVIVYFKKTSVLLSCKSLSLLSASDNPNSSSNFFLCRWVPRPPYGGYTGERVNMN